MSKLDAFAPPEELVRRFLPDYDDLRAPDYWSPSQAKTEARCPRRRWFEKVAGYRSPDSVATQFGTLTHAVLDMAMLGAPINRRTAKEAWRRVKEDRDGVRLLDKREHRAKAIACASSGVLFGPRPAKRTGRGLLIESKVEGVSVDGFPCYGMTDATDLRKHRGRPRVYDWKTCANEAYAETPESLAKNPQGLTYGLSAVNQAVAAGTALKRIKGVKVRFVYMKTKGPAHAWPVDRYMTLGELRRAFDTHVAPVVRDIRKHNQAKLPEEVPANFDACFDFRRACEFTARCHCLRDAGLGTEVGDGGSKVESKIEKQKGRSRALETLRRHMEAIMSEKTKKSKKSKKSEKPKKAKALIAEVVEAYEYQLDAADHKLVKGLAKLGYAKDIILALLAFEESPALVEHQVKPEWVDLDASEGFVTNKGLPEDHPYREVIHAGSEGDDSASDADSEGDDDSASDAGSEGDDDHSGIARSKPDELGIRPPDAGEPAKNMAELRKALGIVDAIDPTKTRRPGGYKASLTELGYRPQQITEMPPSTVHWVISESVPPDRLYELVGYLDEDAKLALNTLDWPPRAIRSMQPTVAELVLTNTWTPAAALEYADGKNPNPALVKFLESGALRPLSEIVTAPAPVEPAPAAEEADDEPSSYVDGLEPIQQPEPVGTVHIVFIGPAGQHTAGVPILKRGPGTMKDSLTQLEPGVYVTQDRDFAWAMYGRWPNVEVICG